jgi:hypothetical protein
VAFFDVNQAREVPSDLDAKESVELEKVDPEAIKQLEVQPTQPIGGGNWMPSSIKMPSLSVKIGGKIAEDIRMTKEAFNTLIQQMVPLVGDLCPLQGQLINPFNTQMMPELSCPLVTLGGNKKRSKKSKKTCKKPYKKTCKKTYKKTCKKT